MSAFRFIGTAFVILVAVTSTSFAQIEPPSDAADTDTISVSVTCEALVLNTTLYFDHDDLTILQQSEAPLVEVARVIRESPWIHLVRIESHTDSMGSSAFNMNRTNKRAQVVRDFLVSHGVPPERLEARGFGETRPIASNDTPEGREQNRRIEFVIAEQEGCPL